MTTEIPQHVPEDLVRHFDCFDMLGDAEDIQLAWKRVQDEFPPIFWTPCNGGHWVATRASAIEAILNDHERFSTLNFIVPKTPRMIRALPNSADPPEHRHFKSLVTPAFLPRATRHLVDTAHAASAEIVARLAARGQCEFVVEAAVPLTNRVAGVLFGMTPEQTDEIRGLTDGMVRSSDIEVRRLSLAGMGRFVGDRIAENRASPRDNVFSVVATAQIDGRPIRDDEAMGLSMVLLTGPLENITNLLGFVMYTLARNPELQRRLRADPDAIGAATDELLRRNGVAATSRELRCDTVFNGVELREGDMIQVPNVLHGLDPDRVPDPLALDLDREIRPEHAVFGLGIHRCAGFYLVREEVKAFLQAWMKAIPEFAVEQGPRPTMGGGHFATIADLRLTWSAATRAPEREIAGAA